MTTLNRLVIAWSGTSVKGAAVNVLHWDGSDNAAPPVAAVKSAFQTASFAFPNGVTITIPNAGDRIDDRTGELVGVWTQEGGGDVVGSGNATGPAGVGACINWLTGGIVNGRRLKGRSFIVPLSSDCYASDGTLETVNLARIQTLAEGLRTAGPLAVWHRPTSKGATDGVSYGVLSSRVRDHVAFLSSRRD